MKVIRASFAGFCSGVSLALKTLDETLAKNVGSRASLVTLGPIIHNPLVMEAYAAQGVRCLDDNAAIPPGSHVVIRAHGIPREKEAELKTFGLILIDATCPKVKKAQLAIANESSDGKFLLLFGEKEHPEVRGLISYAKGQTFVFSHLDELRAFTLSNEHRYFLAAQTTQDRVAFQAARNYLTKKFGATPSTLNTICNATKRRQEEVVALAEKVEAMVVVGGFNSGNTRRLADVARAQGIPAWHVEKAEDLPPEALKGFVSVGLTAGASTPEEHINTMQQFLEGLS